MSNEQNVSIFAKASVISALVALAVLILVVKVLMAIPAWVYVAVVVLGAIYVVRQTNLLSGVMKGAGEKLVKLSEKKKED